MTVSANENELLFCLFRHPFWHWACLCLCLCCVPRSRTTLRTDMMQLREETYQACCMASASIVASEMPRPSPSGKGLLVRESELCTHQQWLATPACIHSCMLLQLKSCCSPAGKAFASELLTCLPTHLCVAGAPHHQGDEALLTHNDAVLIACSQHCRDSVHPRGLGHRCLPLVENPPSPTCWQEKPDSGSSAWVWVAPNARWLLDNPLAAEKTRWSRKCIHRQVMSLHPQT